jgi:hypothetical protein
VCKDWAYGEEDQEYDFDSEEFFNDTEFDEGIEGGEGPN